jgi:hypothetical protein
VQQEVIAEQISLSYRLLEENKCKVLPEESMAVTTAKGNDSPKMFKILEVPIRMENSEIVIEENIAIMETLPTGCTDN